MIPSPVVPMMTPSPVVPMMLSSPVSPTLGSPIMPFVPPVIHPAKHTVSPMKHIMGQTIGSTMLMSPAAAKPIQAPSPSIGKSLVPGSTGTWEIEGYNIESNMTSSQHLDPAPFPEN